MDQVNQILEGMETVKETITITVLSEYGIGSILVEAIQQMVREWEGVRIIEIREE